MTTPQSKTSTPQYRVIMNWDGDDALSQAEVPMSRDKLVDVLYGGLEGTAVDCAFWNGSAGSTAFYPSEVLEFKGDADGGGCDGVMPWRSIANARAMIQRGEDPNESAIAGAREKGLDIFYSCRMNDQHQDPTDMPRLKREHPELRLGDTVPPWFSTSWDYTHARVREHRLDMVRELADNYDFDGIELDWQRHAHHLPVHHAFRRRYVLTDFMRLARQIVRQAGERRGRPLWLAARVAASHEACLHVGYDVEQWVEEELVDYLIPSACAEMDSSLDGRWWVELCRDRPIRVYPSLGGFFYNETHGTGDQETHFQNAVRAVAARLLAEGVDGLYTFNWYTQQRLRHTLLAQMGAAATLARASKTYISTVRVYRAPGSGFAGIDDQDRIYGEVPVELHPTTTEVGPIIRWNVVDDAPAAAADGQLEGITLRLHLQDWSTRDTLAVHYDGRALGEPTIRFPQSLDKNTTGEVGNVAWIEYALAPEAGAPGDHTVQVCLRQRNPDLSGPLVLRDVDLESVYRE